MAGEEGAHSETKSAASSSSSASKLGVAAPERSLVCGSLLHDEPGALDDGAAGGGNQGTISEGAGAGRALLGSGGVAVPCRGVPPRSFAAQSRLTGSEMSLRRSSHIVASPTPRGLPIIATESLAMTMSQPEKVVSRSRLSSPCMSQPKYHDERGPCSVAMCVSFIRARVPVGLRCRRSTDLTSLTHDTRGHAGPAEPSERKKPGAVGLHKLHITDK